MSIVSSCAVVLDGWLSAGNWVLTCMCVCVALGLDVGGLGGRNWVGYVCVFAKFIVVAYVSGLGARIGHWVCDMFVCVLNVEF